MENYYEILGVPEDADDDTIKSEYRKLAKEWHPDLFRQEGEEKIAEASKKFKAINEAYVVLSDADQRRQYDAHRKNPTGKFDFDWRQAQQKAGMDPFFAEMMNRFRDNFVAFDQYGNTIHINIGGRKQPKENRTVNFDLEMYPESTLKEQEATVGIPRRIYCNKCEGEGCQRCKNQGWQDTVESKKVKIPPFSVGKKLRLKGMGWQMDPTQESGDLYLRISLKDSRNFRILNGFNLETVILADPTVAIIGGRGIITTLEGEQRAVDLDSGLAPGSHVCLGKYGVTLDGERTELVGIVIYEAQLDISDERRKMLENYQEGLACQKIEKLGKDSVSD